jgi:hypothetical protein
MKNIEIKEGDIIIFKSKSGSASFVKVDDKGIYFKPAKEGMNLDGIKFPIKRNEAFVYNNVKVLEVKGACRVLRIELTRLKTGQSCYLSEDHFHNYFVKPENQLNYG